MTTNQITLLNTISRVPATFDEDYAKRLLADPHYGKILRVVNSEKPEVLGNPTINGEPVDEEGNPVEQPVRLSKAKAEKLTETSTEEKD
jgi:hypothetical protein